MVLHPVGDWSLVVSPRDLCLAQSYSVSLLMMWMGGLSPLLANLQMTLSYVSVLVELLECRKALQRDPNRLG